MMTLPPRLALTLLATSAWLAASLGLAASPRLGNVTPRGFQRGQQHEVTFHGSNLGDAQEILFYGTGFEVSGMEPGDDSVKVTVQVAENCRLGEHMAQVRTASGISDYRTFFIEALPAVAENEPNNDFDAPQPIALNVTVGGSVGSEDVDYYVVEAQKGQRISAEVVALRLGSAMFDPYVAILDSKRFELSANDDTALALQDAFASTVAPEDGKYIIEVREAAYGSGNTYRLHVGTFPRPTAVFPAGGKLAEQIEVRYLGIPSGELLQQITLPSESTDHFGLTAEDEHGVAPTPNAFRLFEHGNAFESEPNDELAQATPVELPLAFNGIIERPGDIDCFKFQAKKDQEFEVECYARRVRSALDSVMNLYKADGTGIADNDDSRGPDSYFRFKAPEDGEYVIRVTDHLGSGGPDYVYRIEFQRIRPVLSLSIPRVERYGQYRQQVYVARGNRFATLINANRTNFGGELILDGNDLPEGVTMHAQPMPANLNTMPVVFEADPEAPIAGKLVDFTARHADPQQNVSGRFHNSAIQIVAEPNQSVYKTVSVNRLAVAVVDELPFSIEIVEPKVPLVRNGSMQLKIIAHKKDGWDETINVQFPFHPPGVGASSSVDLPKGKNEVLYPINANGNAEIKKWQVYALGTSGGMWASSQLANLEIANPFVTFELQRAACEQGQEAQVLCKLTQHAPFEGNAQTRLLGIPPKVATTELGFDSQTQELIFDLKTEPDSPVGKHNLHCQVTIMQNGEPIVSGVGDVQLQIDEPLPPPADAPEQPKPEPMPEPVVEQKPDEAKPKPKPLTRLQKLRLAAKQRKQKQQENK